MSAHVSQLNLARFVATFRAVMTWFRNIETVCGYREGIMNVKGTMHAPRLQHDVYDASVSHDRHVTTSHAFVPCHVTREMPRPVGPALF